LQSSFISVVNKRRSKKRLFQEGKKGVVAEEKGSERRNQEDYWRGPGKGADHPYLPKSAGVRPSRITAVCGKVHLQKLPGTGIPVIESKGIWGGGNKRYTVLFFSGS